MHAAKNGQVSRMGEGNKTLRSLPPSFPSSLHRPLLPYSARPLFPPFSAPAPGRFFLISPYLILFWLFYGYEGKKESKDKDEPYFTLSEVGTAKI